MEKIYELQTYLRKRAKSNPVFGTGIEVKWKDRGVLRAGEVRGEIYYKGARMELIQNKSASSLDCTFVGYHMLGFEEIKLTPADTRLLEKIFFWGPTCTPGEFKKMVEKEIKKIEREGLNKQNLETLYKLVDIHKDIANEQYWDTSEGVMDMYDRDDYGARGRRGTGRSSMRGRGRSSGTRYGNDGRMEC